MKPIKLLMVLAVQMTLMFAGTQLRAQSLAYSNAIVALNPAGYWPMHETAAPAPADIETNYGSLGALGTAYYADWWENNGAPGNSDIIHGYPGPLQNVPNSCVYMLDEYQFGTVTANNRNTSWAVVPHTSPLTALAPPFTVEAWVYGSNGDFGDIVGIDGTALNGGNNNNGFGFRFSWGGGTAGNIFQSYDEGFAGNGGTTAFTTNAWHYAVLVGIITTNGSTLTTNWDIYVDNSLYGASANSGFKPDNWDPLLIGGGMWNNTGSVRTRDMGLADVAVYTSALSSNQIAAHYYAATNTSAGPNDYYNAVLGNNPLLFYHMDSPAFPGWTPTNTWPVLHNYGSAAGNGFYMPGVTPGAAMGPPFAGDLPIAMPGNGLSAYADAGTNSLYNPTGHAPFSITACFQGNPADSRLESLAGHGDNSWHLRLDTSGKVHFGTGAQASDVISPGIYNDGNWHVAVGVYDGANNYLYVDGSLAVSAANPNPIIGTNVDALVGSDPQYNIFPAQPPGSSPSACEFAGNLCDVAYFANALTAAQIKTLYNAMGVPVSSISTPALSRAGSSDVITVTANGSSPAYQWYLNTVPSYSGATGMTDGGGVSGSATASVTIANLTDYYFAVATNNWGAITSSIVQVPMLNALAAGQPIWNQTGQSNVLVAFSLALDPITSTTLGNYSLNNGASVLSATLVASNEVALTTSVLNPMTSYILTVQNVENIYGIAVSPSPTNLAVGLYPANLALWVKANTGVTADASGNVSQWNDLSGNLNDLYVLSAIDPVQTNNAQGYTVIRFTGTNNTQMYANPASSLGITGDMTVATVINFATLAGGTNGDIVSKTGAGVRDNIPSPYDCYVGSAGTILRGNGGGTTAGVNYGQASATIGPSVGLPHILIATEYGNTVSFFLDGQPAGTGLLGNNYQETNDADALQSVFIGARGDNHNRLTGDLFEMTVAGSAISTNDALALANYLGAEYNVPVAPNTYVAITHQPAASTTMYQGYTLTLSATASGNPLALQWYSTNGIAVAGQTNAMLVIPNIQTTNSYYLVATNIFNAVTSSVANVNVIAVNPNPTNIVFSVTNNQLTLKWPADHTGWTLQAQTNGLLVGISTNWISVSSPTTTNRVVVPINLTNGTVFYRLVYP